MVFQAAEHVLGSVLCAPGCFSVYRCSALKDIVPTYATTVERAFDFLIKDMGEDRWLCTLMVRVVGWVGIGRGAPKGEGGSVALYSHGVCNRGSLMERV